MFAEGLAGFAVLVIFAGYDLHTTELMRTPSVLHAHFAEGSEVAASVSTSTERALVYTLIHFVAWCGVGMSAAYLWAVSRIDPWLWYAAVLSPALVLVAPPGAAGVWAIPGLGVHHLWVGALVGAVVMYGFFLWRNPDLLHHLGTT